MNHSFKSKFIKESHQRGFIHQSTDLQDLDKKMSEKPIVAYIGFDATADGLHVGSLVQIMWLRLLQRTGNKPIILIGESTTKIGDPSDKNSLRKILQDEEIKHNVKSIKKILQRYLKFGDGPTDALIVNNEEWLSKLNYLKVLKRFGSYFTLNRMLTFESVKRRLKREQPLTFLEFNYIILQSIDFFELNNRFNCVLQMAGADQWSNIISGINLIKRINKSKAFGITTPLITTTTGEKMGKTAQGALWLNKDKSSTFNYWQYWRNTADEDVFRFLKIFTEIKISEIQKLYSLKGSNINEAKIILANAATNITHGKEASIQAAKTADSIFKKSNTNLDLEKITINQNQIDGNGISILDILQRSKLTHSRSESRRLIRAGATKLNDIKIFDETKYIKIKDFKENNYLKLSIGHKKHIKIILNK